MAIVFNPDLDYQNEAIKSVVELFSGQEQGFSGFTIYDPTKVRWKKSFGVEETELGLANKLELDNEELLKNLNKVQLENHLKSSDFLKPKELNFAIEMETGTGKTYVYLKTIFELCKNYGFKKFIILVPSVAIREGVLSSLRMLKEHFEYHYSDFPFHSFQYSSTQLPDLMEFARSDKIEIMVMTIQSLDSDNKVLNSHNQKHLEQTYGVIPLDVIRETNPIVIIDEPQTTSGSDSRKGYISKLNPLCTLQYSATHKAEKNVHKIYRLTAVNAYIKKLVKEIEVASVIPKNDNNFAYVHLIDVTSKNNKIIAKIEIDVRNSKKNIIERKTVTVNPENDLFEISGRRCLYTGMQVRNFLSRNSIEINGETLCIGDKIGDFDKDELKRIQIRKTIEEHFKKEQKLNPKGIKVLSLFFIDKVANYRSWDSDNQVVNGKFLKWFEEEYEILRKKYINNQSIVAINIPVGKVHQGYFAEDSKQHFKDTKGESVDDVKAYESIMSDKEYLLSFDNPIRFIFSHSALREGWDNPNVFQICTLNESSKSNDRKRQEIGRGLRICVNQEGERVYGFETNKLTVMANQSYEDFAKQLQGEIEKDEGFKFGSIEALTFAAIPISTKDGIVNMTEQESKSVYEFCQSNGYVDSSGNITEKLKDDLMTESINIPEELKKYEWEILEELKKSSGNLNIRSSEEKISYKVNKQIVPDNPYFKELWSRIKDKVKYSVRYDTAALIQDCAEELKENLKIKGIEIEYKKATLVQNTTGIQGTVTNVDYEDVATRHRYLPDILSFLQNATNLTRSTIHTILNYSETLYMFYTNPEKYMSEVANIIKKVINKIALQGIKYTKIAESEYYLQEVFPDEERQDFLSDLVKSSRSIYEYNRFDYGTEEKFAKALESDEKVLVYAKLPTRKFIVPTPIGDYTPDWAIVLDDHGEKKLYFVIETKGSTDGDDLRNKELLKLKYGKKRFEQVGGACFVLAKSKDEFIYDVRNAKDDGHKTSL